MLNGRPASPRSASAVSLDRYFVLKTPNRSPMVLPSYAPVAQLGASALPLERPSTMARGGVRTLAAEGWPITDGFSASPVLSQRKPGAPTSLFQQAALPSKISITADERCMGCLQRTGWAAAAPCSIHQESRILTMKAAPAVWLLLPMAGAKLTNDRCDPTRERDDHACREQRPNAKAQSCCACPGTGYCSDGFSRYSPPGVARYAAADKCGPGVPMA